MFFSILIHMYTYLLYLHENRPLPRPPREPPLRHVYIKLLA